MSKPSLHSWRYCVLGEGDLAAEPLYQSSESWRRSRHERRSREKYLFQTYFNTYFKRLVPTPFFWIAAPPPKLKSHNTQYRQLRRLVKTSGNGPGVGECPALGQCKICKCPTPGTDKACKFPAVAREGGGLGAGGIDWCVKWWLMINHETYLYIFYVKVSLKGTYNVN